MLDAYSAAIEFTGANMVPMPSPVTKRSGASCSTLVVKPEANMVAEITARAPISTARRPTTSAKGENRSAPNTIPKMPALTM